MKRRSWSRLQKTDYRKQTTDKKSEVRSLKSDEEQGSKEQVLSQKQEKEVKELKTDKQTPLKTLKLSRKITNKLKEEGLECIEDIINIGPDGLTDIMSLEASEIVDISRAMKKYIEENKLNS